MALRRFDVILFDLGDTLIYFDDDWPSIFSQAIQELLKSLQTRGINLGQDFIHVFYERMNEYYRERDTEFIEYTTHFVLTNLLRDWGYADIEEGIILGALQDMHKITQSHWIPEKDALTTLEVLYQRGYRLALVSNAADDPNTQVLVDKLGARPYFEVIVSSAAAGIRKPNPRIFLSVLECMQVSPHHAAMVGDTLAADILGAQNAGIFSIWITRRADRPANHAHLDTIRPDGTIHELKELPDLLDRLSN